MRRLALGFPELPPVDASLARIDVLLHQLSREFLQPPVDLALDQRGRRVEAQPLSQLLQQVGAHLAGVVFARFFLQVGCARGRRSAASDSKSPRSLANSSSSSGSTRRRTSFTVTA